MGDYPGLEDFQRRAVFADEIGRYCYPVDIHPYKPSPETYKAFEQEFHQTLRYAPGESYGIPYRCLTPQKTSNLLVAGRCISCDQKMQGSVRVMPGCFITGQAAGMAAAMCCQNNCHSRALDIKSYCKDCAKSALSCQMRKICQSPALQSGERCKLYWYLCTFSPPVQKGRHSNLYEAPVFCRPAPQAEAWG